MPILIPPPVPGDWSFHVNEVQTEQVELPWSVVEDFPRWQEGRTFCSIVMEPLDAEARSVVRADLIGRGFVLRGMQHLIIDVDSGRPFVVRTQAWPAPPEEGSAMTVAELIAKLQEMPPEARVVLENHYDGFDDTDEVDTAPIVLGRLFPGVIGGDHKRWGHYMKNPPDETAVVIR